MVYARRTSSAVCVTRMNTHCSSKGRFNYEFLLVHPLSAVWVFFKLTLRAQFATGWSIVKFGHADARA